MPQASGSNTISTANLSLESVSGCVRQFRYAGRSLMHHGSSHLRLRMNGTDLTPVFAGAAEEQSATTARLVVRYTLNDYAGYEVRETIELGETPEKTTLLRRLSLSRTGEGRPDRLESATLIWEGLSAGDPATTLVSFPMSRMRPAEPLATTIRRPGEMHPTKPDAAGYYSLAANAFDTHVGAITLADVAPQHPLHLALLPLPRRCPAWVKLHGTSDGRAMHIEQTFASEFYVASDQPEIIVAEQLLLIQPSQWQQALPAVGQELSRRGYAPPAQRPAWAKNPRILEVTAAYYGGFRGLLAKLDDIHDAGFDTLYLMPWHAGTFDGYGTSDYDQMNPAKGTRADLRALCDAAHARGMHVLFDLLVNIAIDDSPYVKEHPEWFYRDEKGRFIEHPAWKNNMFDPAVPGFARFLTDYCVRCVRDLGADGFRVDAVAYRGGNWHGDPALHLQPHEHSYAVFTLIGEIRAAIRAANPDAILMAECFGPDQVPISDLVCYQWVEWLKWSQTELVAGRLTGSDIARCLAEQFAVMPPGTWFTLYTHTHDTIAFTGTDMEGPRIDALFTTLAFLGAGIMQFGGGWKMRQRPATGSETAWYARVMAAKARLGGVAGSDVQWIFGDHPHLLIADRPSEEGVVRIITNFGDTPVEMPAGFTPLFSRLNSPGNMLVPGDTIVLLPLVPASAARGG